MSLPVQKNCLARIPARGIDLLSSVKYFLPFSSYLFLNFLFCIGVRLANNVVIVSGGQQRDSAISICICIRSAPDTSVFFLIIVTLSHNFLLI